MLTLCDVPLPSTENNTHTSKYVHLAKNVRIGSFVVWIQKKDLNVKSVLQEQKSSDYKKIK